MSKFKEPACEFPGCGKLTKELFEIIYHDRMLLVCKEHATPDHKRYDHESENTKIAKNKSLFMGKI